ncbi:nucleotidyl transferase AbiEii/AbiGii toxin family protein [Cedecea sp.]|jgi:hypothetical protein|uniref:nucleotidyl transferase AbiEii/AbiGii toxin family protein n=1 Tax=Cedecea sp. TaxID=1970739 RepID=UPI002F3EC00B
MDRGSPFYRQVALLVRTLPVVALENCFALKGGTAINLFIRNFPRLSVDIDLAYIPLENRDEALPHVREALSRIAAILKTQSGMNAVLQTNSSDEMRIIVSAENAQIKVDFLLSFKSGKPDWALAPESQMQHLPAVQWKLRNINKMSASKHANALEKLENILATWLH